MRLPASLALTLAFSLSPLAQAASSDPVLTRADQLINQRQAAAAFDLLAPLEDERAGDPDYDYLLGLAALETGRGGVAAFAFERCLAVDPKNGPCRVQMARTHLALGENGAAREELQAVQASAPPAEVNALVSQYLGALTQREKREKRRIDLHAQIGFGHDSNVSSTTAENQIAIPGFPSPLLLSGTSTKQKDSLFQGEINTRLDYALSPAWSLLADAGLGTRQYVDIDTFNSLNADAGLGLAWRTGPNSVLAKLQAQDYSLDGNAFRSLYGTMIQFQHAYGDEAAVSLYLQTGHLDYHFGMPDADRITLGTGYSRSLESTRATTVYVGLYGGQEESDQPGVGLGQDFAGLRFGGSVAALARLALTASFSGEQRSFDGVNPTFLIERKDTAFDLSLGAVFKASKKVSLRPAYTYSHSNSNFVLSDYDRHVVTLDLRYDL